MFCLILCKFKKEDTVLADALLTHKAVLVSLLVFIQTPAYVCRTRGLMLLTLQVSALLTHYCASVLLLHNFLVFTNAHSALFEFK